MKKFSLIITAGGTSSRYGNTNKWLSREAIDIYDEKYQETKAPTKTSNKPTVQKKYKTYINGLEEGAEEIALLSTKMTDVFLAEVKNIPIGINLCIVNNDIPNSTKTNIDNY